jgi:hypothetical protein
MVRARRRHLRRKRTHRSRARDSDGHGSHSAEAAGVALPVLATLAICGYAGPDLAD